MYLAIGKNFNLRFTASDYHKQTYTKIRLSVLFTLSTFG